MLHTADAISRLQASRIVTKLRSFLGISYVLRRFVRYFGGNAPSSNGRVRTIQQFNFLLNKKKLNLMKTFQQELIALPVMAVPCAEGRMTFCTDTYDVLVRWALLRIHIGQTTETVGYWSRSLTISESLHDKTERELEILCLVLLIRPYLDSKRGTIRTDHDSLMWLVKYSDASELSRHDVNGRPSFTLMILTEPVQSTRQPTHCRDVALLLKGVLT